LRVMIPTEETAKRVCNIPADFHRRGDTSVFQLVRESGYADADTSSLRFAVEQQLRTHPTLSTIGSLTAQTSGPQAGGISRTTHHSR